MPENVTRGYALLASGWIVVSDLALHLVGDPQVRDTATNIGKGLLFVLVTSLGLWWMLQRLTRTHDQKLLATANHQRDLYLTILQTASDPVGIYDLAGRLAWMNAATTDQLGWTFEESAGRLGRDFIAPKDRTAAIGYLENIAEGRTVPSVRTFDLLHRDGSTRTMAVRASVLTTNGQVWGVVFIARDVTERARRNDQLLSLFDADATGLPTLSSFTATIDGLEALLDGDDATLVVVVADIERFGTINELYGRAAGDVVLREVAERFRSALPEALGSWRHGADSYLGILVEDEDQNRSPIDFRHVVDRLRHEIGAPIAINDDDRVSVKVALAVAEVRTDGDLPLATRLLRAGEHSLRQAQQHPDRFVLAGPADASADMEDRAQLVAQLHDALREGQLVAHYQPKVDLGDLTVVGSEALVRWDHPTRGLLPPSEFLWAMEFANLTGELTHAMLRQALHQAQAWRSSEESPSHTVSVNITLNELRREHFVDEVMGLIAEAGIEPAALCLELTEQELLADVIATTDTVNQLREAGIQIAIDDFGTGYSSLEHLRLLSVDELKIDLSFIQGLVPGSPDDVIVSSVIGLGSGLGVTVTAEGIEERAALAHLRDLGCQRGQGYLFSRAVPPESFPHRLTDVMPA
ncbi:MAG: EAL domain-containing protein [Acidimicrobiales bacterium]|nr:EAL domain-containing protein [Acidimicrobiales bacterium]